MRNKAIFFLIILLAVGFFYRIYGLWLNYSFWTDEAATARYGRGVLETGFAKIKETNFTSDAYFVTHYLTGFSFAVFGQNEFAARLPEVVFGTILIGVIYLLGSKLFGPAVGLGGAFLTTFSYIQIAWSRQARGYSIFEVFFILTLFWLYKLLEDKKIFSLFAFLVFLTLTVLTHTLGLVLVPIIILFWLICAKSLKALFSSKIFWISVLAVIFLLLFLPVTKKIGEYLLSYKLSRFWQGENFLSYYHSLFWRGYPLLVFLAFLGLAVTWFKEKNRQVKVLFFLTIFLVYLIFVSFFVHVPFEKYTLALFPLLFLCSSVGLYKISGLFFEKKSYRQAVYLLLLVFILFNGNKFTFKPKRFYSLNFDMREIPEVDYKGIYQMIAQKIKEFDRTSVAIVDIDEDVPAWYLGEGRNYFNPRNDMAGEEKSLSVWATYIHSQDEFKKIQSRFKYGFLVLLEHNFRFYPEGLVDYARSNLKLERKEEYPWFSPDWNRWPVEVYSWGFNPPSRKSGPMDIGPAR